MSRRSRWTPERLLPRCSVAPPDGGRGKVRFRTEHEALEALARGERSGSPKRAEQRAYWCRDCGGWHLTSQGLPI